MLRVTTPSILLVFAAAFPQFMAEASDALPPDVGLGFEKSLVTSLERDELLRALSSVISGLLQEGNEVPELAAKVEPQLHELMVAWDC